MIDTHFHLTDPRLLTQAGDVLRRAHAAGVTRMVSIGTDLADDRATIDACRGYAQLRCAVGVHPNYVEKEDFHAMPTLRAMASEPEVVALGEMGLDYHYDGDRKRQAQFFQWQLNLAVEVNLPVVIHCREAADDVLAIMKDFPAVRAVVHCFTGTTDEARRILDQGYLIGYTGVVTFKKSEALRECIAITPMDRLLVETDAPYLSPEPMRKQVVNEPSLVVHVAATVAKVKGVSVEEIDRATTENAERFFGWKA